MKILLTGGTGYIGSHTAVELIQLGHEVEILDNLSNSKITVLDRIEKITGTKPKFHQIDLLEADKVDQLFANGGFDLVIHFAGLKAVGESVEQPLRYYETNLEGTINLLKSMRAHNCKKIIFSSSATVYGVQESPEYVETMITGAGISNPYGRTKYMIEEIMKDLTAADPEFQVTLLRYFNPVGAHKSGLLGEDPNGIPNNLMPIIMRVSTGKIPVLSIFGDDYDTPDGTCKRDYIHVVDLAKGHVAAISHMQPGVSIYNLGTGNPLSVKEIVAAFDKASGKTLPTKIADRRAGDLAIFYANPAKAEKELGWHAELGLDDIMEDTINFLKHEAENEA